MSKKLGFGKKERAVSPIIGVVLLLMITVILSASVAAFAFGFGDSVDESESLETHDSDWDWHQEEMSNGDLANISLTHDGGEPIEGDELSISLTGTEEEATLKKWGTVSAGDSVEISEEVEPEFSSGTFDGPLVAIVGTFNDDEPENIDVDDAVVLSKDTPLEFNQIERVNLVWEPDDGDSQTLSTHKVN